MQAQGLIANNVLTPKFIIPKMVPLKGKKRRLNPTCQGLGEQPKMESDQSKV